MKYGLIIIGLIGLVAITNPIYAKKHSIITSAIQYTISDTVYYLHDTSLIQKSSFQIKAYNGSFGKLFVIKCGCLTIGDGNIYLQSLKKKIIIDEQKMKLLKLITLSDLINFVKANNTPNFGDNALEIKHSVYIIEPSKPGYIMYKVYNTSMDYEVVK